MNLLILSKNFEIPDSPIFWVMVPVCGSSLAPFCNSDHRRTCSLLMREAEILRVCDAISLDSWAFLKWVVRWSAIEMKVGRIKGREKERVAVWGKKGKHAKRQAITQFSVILYQSCERIRKQPSKFSLWKKRKQQFSLFSVDFHDFFTL